MPDFSSLVMTILGSLGAIASIHEYISMRSVERNRPREELRADLENLRNSLLELRSDWIRLGHYLKQAEGWDPTARFGDRTMRGFKPKPLAAAVGGLLGTIYERNNSIAHVMLDVLGGLGTERLAVSEDVLKEVKSLAKQLDQIRCGDIDNAQADALTNEVITRALELIEKLLESVRPRSMSAGTN